MLWENAKPYEEGRERVLMEVLDGVASDRLRMFLGVVRLVCVFIAEGYTVAYICQRTKTMY